LLEVKYYGISKPYACTLQKSSTDFNASCGCGLSDGEFVFVLKHHVLKTYGGIFLTSSLDADE